MNKVILIGNLVKEVETKSLDSGKVVAKFSLAVKDGFGDESQTYYINVSAWGKQAENCAKFLNKGSKVAIVGKLCIKPYETKDGVRTYTEVVANEVDFLTFKSTEKEETAKVVRQPRLEEITDDDIPF